MNQGRLGGLHVLVVSPFAAGTARGNATSAARLARRLASLGASSRFVSSQTEGALKSALAKRRPDVLVGIHAGHFSRALTAAGWRLHDVHHAMPPLVLVIGGNELYEDLGVAPAPETPGHMRPTSWALFERADAVLVATEHQLREVLERRPKRVFLIPRYPEVGFGPIDGLTAWLEAQPAGPTLTWCGALRPQKRPEWILPIFEAVRGAHPNAKLMLAGPAPSDGPGMQLETTLTRTPGIHRVAPFGAGPQGSIGTLLARTDLALNTSRSEGMSNFLLESMHEGVPVVAADCEGTRTWIDDQAALFHTPEEAAAKIIALFNDHTAAQALGQAGKRWVDNWSSPEREADALATAIEAAIEHAGSTSNQ